MVGSLLYAAISTRPDIGHAVSMLTRFMQNPGPKHVVAARRVLRYLKGTTSTGLVFNGNNGQEQLQLKTGHKQQLQQLEQLQRQLDQLQKEAAQLQQGSGQLQQLQQQKEQLQVQLQQLQQQDRQVQLQLQVQAYSDADWAGDRSSCKSTSGYLIMINGCLVHWGSKKQSTVSLSTAEAEYVAMSSTTQEIIWAKQLLAELTSQAQQTAVIKTDSTAAMAMCHNDNLHHKTKHIDIKHHFIRDEIKNKRMRMEWVPTHLQLADIMTKPLKKLQYERLRDKLMYGIEIEV